MAGRMDTFGMTDIGLVRSRNEDQFLIADLKKSVIIHQTSLSYDDETHLMGKSHAQVFLVADGVGGSEAGDRASRMAIQGVVQYLLNAMHWLFPLDDNLLNSFLDELKGAFAFSQEKLHKAAAMAAPHESMSTTITMAYLVWPQLYLIHAGDSRAYVHRNNELTRLTHDQTYAQTLVDAGLMKETELRTSPLRNVLSGLVGGDPSHFHPEITQFKLNLHDKLLLCTDGLTAHVTETQIAQMLCEERTSEEVCQRLIDRANEAGGRDNITVVLVQFTDDSRPHERTRVEERAIPEPEQDVPSRQLLVESLTVTQESILAN